MLGQAPRPIQKLATAASDQFKEVEWFKSIPISNQSRKQVEFVEQQCIDEVGATYSTYDTRLALPVVLHLFTTFLGFMFAKDHLIIGDLLSNQINSLLYSMVATNSFICSSAVFKIILKPFELSNTVQLNRTVEDQLKKLKANTGIPPNVSARIAFFRSIGSGHTYQENIQYKLDRK